MTLSRTPTRCKHCKVKFSKEEKGMRIHADCIDGFVAALRVKQAAKQEKERKAKARVERAQDRQKREAQKSIKRLKAEAQAAFNPWVRKRDEALPCVSCGDMNPPVKPGGQWDAGHFLGRGAYPELAFEEDNCHKQCKSCNGGSGRFAHKERTVNQKYEEELLRRIGPDRLAALRAPRPVKKWTREELIAIRATYKRKLKELTE